MSLLNSKLQLTVVFGNRNQATLVVDPNKTTVGQLYSAVDVIVSTPGGSDLLNLVAGGRVLGQDPHEMSGYLSETGLFLNRKGVVSVTLQLPDLPYNDGDLLARHNMRRCKHKNSSNTIQGNNTSEVLTSMLNSAIFGQDVIITIDPADYSGYVTVVPTSDVVEYDNCPICQNTLEGDTEVHQLECTHQFHSNCLRSWLTERSCRCPVCNYDVREA